MKSLTIKQTYGRLKSILLLALFMSVAGYQKMQAQDDPFTRLKKVADSETELKSQARGVTIAKTNPVWKANAKAVIPFKPIDMKDASGRTIPPDEIMTLKNGQKMTAREYFAKLNQLERSLNLQGYSLRDQQKATVSKTITSSQELEGRLNSVPKPIGQLRTGDNLKKFMDPTENAGEAVLKPYARYSNEEKKRLNSLRIETENGKLVARKVQIPPGPSPAVPISSSPLKTINETSTKDWRFGSSSTFRAGIRGDLIRYAKLYQFDPRNPERSKSEFKVTAKGKVYGSLFNHSFDFVNASAVYYSPADTAQDMSVTVVVSVVGINVLNLRKTYDQVKTITGRIAKNFDKSFPISFPIVGPISFSGKVGVKGMVGLEYEGNLYRTFVNLSAKPIAEISGYAEAGLSIGVAGIGVGGRLTFLKGELDLDGFAGIIFQNPEQIVAAVSYYFGHDLTILKGELYAYAEVGWCPVCWEGEHTIFRWDGFRSSGTIAEGTRRYVIANVPRSSTAVLTEVGTH